MERDFPKVGIVVIGRNEGERLVRCLSSLQHLPAEKVSVIYVDSGSVDGSREVVARFGVAVVELDDSAPFTAARARNTGFGYLQNQCSELKYVQFVDGDCEMVDGWLEKALAVLEQTPHLAIACGRRKERFPEVSVYNLLADMEWNTPVGEAAACGGDALVRVAALKEVGGYNPDLICGEEPEMCIRLRRKGWKILRLDEDMTLHDAAMVKLGQWWKRAVRGGWAVAEGYAMYGASEENYRVREYYSGFFWSLFLPILSFGLAGITSGLSLLLLLGYPYLAWRIYQHRRDRNDSPRHSLLYAFFTVLYKWPQTVGQIQYWLNRWQKRQAVLIEYKGLKSE